MSLLRQLADLLLPQRCAGCGVVGGPWCAACSGTVAPAKRSIVACDSVLVGGVYEGPLRRAVLALKRDRPDLARALAGDLWRDGLPEHVESVTWIPAGPGRRVRGYDQGRHLARAAGWLLRVPSLRLLDHIGPGQRDLPAAERRLNAEHAIRLARRVPCSRLLVVDDVVTTGASLEQSARTLRAGGASTVHGAVIAASTQASPQDSTARSRLVSRLGVDPQEQK